jgi:hypothetical protein
MTKVLTTSVLNDMYGIIRLTKIILEWFILRIVLPK